MLNYMLIAEKVADGKVGDDGKPNCTDAEFAAYAKERRPLVAKNNILNFVKL